MDHLTAIEWLRATLRDYRKLKYARLTSLSGGTELRHGEAPDGTKCEITVTFSMESRGEPVRVLAAIDDGRGRPGWPLRQGFAMSANGEITEL